MRRTILVTVLLAAVGMRAHAQQPAHATITPTSEPDPIADALARAHKDRNYLWVAVCGDSNAKDCRHFDEQTLSAASVKSYMEHRVTLLELDAGTPAGQRFVTQHGIDVLPTVLVLANSGQVLGKSVGDTPPNRFLRVVSAAIQSDAIRGAEGMRSWAGEDVVLKTSDHGAALVAEAKYEEADREYTWCLDHRATRSSMFPVVHLEKLVQRVVALGKVYEPTMKAFLRRLSDAEFASLEHSRPNVYALYLLKYGYLSLDREDKLITHYDRLRQRYPGGNAAPAFATLIYGPLLHARRYEALKRTVSDTEEVALYLQGTRANNVDKSETRKLLAGRYEILLGLGRMKPAKDLAQQMFTYDRSAETYLEFAEAAFRSGHSMDENIAQARSAYDLTEAKSLRAVIVYAKLLAQKTTHSPEAVQVLQQAVRTFDAMTDKNVLTQCLYDVQSGKILPRNSVTARAADTP